MAQQKTKKEKGIIIRTPVGEAIWPRLAEPDKKFATAERPHGTFSTGIALDMADPKVRAIVDQLEALRQEALAEGQAEMKPGKKVKEAQFGWQAEVDEHGAETGRVIINAKKAGAFTRDDGTVVPLKVDTFDTAGNRIPKKVLETMGSGSKIAVILEASKFSTGLGAGVSLRLQAVQVRELVAFGSRSAEGYGFETTGDGFVAAADSETPFTPDEAPTAGAPAVDDSDI